MTQKNNYKKLGKKIGVKVSEDLLDVAFTHRSYVNEHRDEGVEHNERLEFLGDAVLELIATKHLFERCPDKDEGVMTSFRSALVKGKQLAEIAKEIELGQYLRLSKGEEKSGGREKNCILANVLEALIGAIYLDQGYDKADEFIEKFLLTKLDGIIEKDLHIDAKSAFQESCQEKEEITPHYEVVKEEGPDHDKKFTMGVYIKEDLIATGEGSSKQNAEEQAAKNALKEKGWE